MVGCRAEPKRFSYTRVVMGAPCTVTLYAHEQNDAEDAARAAFARLAEIEESLSDWIASSEVRRLPTTAHASTEISPDLRRVLAHSHAFWVASEGAFDPTVSPVVELWRAARSNSADGSQPSSDAIQSARARVGFQHVRVEGNPPRYSCDIDGVRLDFGGIGQGYGADEALKVLARPSIVAALVDLSGDLAAQGAPPDSPRGWRVALRGETILLRDAALTTSGDAFQHLDSDDGATRFSHIIDPRTGRALTTRTTVTVIAPSAVEADALATALSVLGPSAGTEMLGLYPNAAAEWVIEQPNTAATVVRSARWPGLAVEMVRDARGARDARDARDARADHDRSVVEPGRTTDS